MRPIGFLVLLAGAVATGPRPGPRAQPRPPRCEPVSEHGVVTPEARIDTGTYTLTVGATRGPSSGATASGDLFLVSTARIQDSTAGTAAPLVIGDPKQVPLYGATTTDFGGVSAPVSANAGKSAPPPRSFDPHRPGVLVTRRADGGSGVAWRVLVGTVANDRSRCTAIANCPDATPSEGQGVVLDVYRLDRNGFAGSWHAVSDAPVGGYFCAAPMQYYTRFRSPPIAIPPKPH